MRSPVYASRASATGGATRLEPGRAVFFVDCVVVDLPLPPSTNNLFFNGDGRTGRVRTPKYNAWIKEAGIGLNRFPRVAGRVALLIEVSEAESTASSDLANREKAAVDLLVSHQIIQGDSKKYVREIVMRWADVAGVRITIRKCE